MAVETVPLSVAQVNAAQIGSTQDSPTQASPNQASPNQASPNQASIATIQLDADRLEAAPVAPGTPVDQPSGKTAAFKIFFSTFVTIFLAELGDKTQVTTLLMAAESHAPWTVFAGAGTALVATSLLGVWLGSWLAKQVSPRTLETAAGILLLLVSAQLFWEIAQL